MHRRLIIPALLGAALAAAGVSFADTRAQPDPVPVGVKGDKATKGFSSSLAVFVHAPVGWQRGCCYDSKSGEWTGTTFRPSNNPNIQGTASMLWSVDFVKGKSLPAAARAGSGLSFPEVSSGKRTVPHIVGGRKVGKLKAFTVLDAEPSPGARQDGVLAIDLGKHVVAVVSFFASSPAADNTGAAGTITIDGKPASQWNSEQIAASIAGVYVEGNLPPKTVTAAPAGHGKLKGTVKDGFGHPLSEAKLTLQRSAGKGWRKAGSGFTTTRGTFAFKGLGSGRYRVLATVGGTVARSRPVAAR